MSSSHGISQITPQQMIGDMSRGLNLGNVLSAPVEGNWAPAFTETYFEDVESAGFKTVRIPIDFFGTRTTGDTSSYSKNEGTAASYTGSTSDYVVSSSYLDRIEQVITWSLNHKLITILDFHGSTIKSEFLYTFSPKSKWSAYYTHPTSAKRSADNDKFRAIWTAVANRFKNYSYNLIFEVINEPYFWLSDSEMDTLNSDIISIIRNSANNNTDRNIIITGGTKNSYEAPLQIGNAILNSDDNLIATFHYYWPRDFTASSGENENDFDWGNTADKTAIDTDFGAVKTWSQNNNNIPVFLGEFGADNEGGYNYANENYSAFGGPVNASRVEFHKYLAQKAIDLGFAFTAWDAGDKANKTIYKVSDRSWVEDVKDALLGITLGNIDFEKNEDIDIYPNPASNYIEIKTTKTIEKIVLYDVNGRLIPLNYIKNSSKIMLPNITNGMHVLNAIYNNGKHSNHKILINN